MLLPIDVFAQTLRRFSAHDPQLLRAFESHATKPGTFVLPAWPRPRCGGRNRTRPRGCDGGGKASVRCPRRRCSRCAATRTGSGALGGNRHHELRASLGDVDKQ
jgi:hypothetical protein